MKRAVVIALLACACATSPARGDEQRAACAAQQFLQENGYLGTGTDQTLSLNQSETERFVQPDGSIDWAGLSASRRDTFSNRLIGASRDAEGFQIIYQMDAGVRRCIRASADLAMMHLSATPCQATPAVGLTEDALRCVRIHLDGAL